MAIRKGNTELIVPCYRIIRTGSGGWDLPYQILGGGSPILGSADSAQSQDQPAQGLESKGLGSMV